MEELRVSIVQKDLVWQNVEANLTSFEKILSPLKGETDIIILPEMFTTGFTMDAENFAEEKGGSTEVWMTDIAKNLNAVVTGSIIVNDNGKFLNRLLWFEPDGTLRTYDKKHLFRMAGEEKVFTAGEELPVWEYNGWKICPQICYDLRFPVYHRNTDNKYDLLFFVANWPEARIHHWETLLKARAIENLAYVAGVNRVGTDGKGFNYVGSTAMIDPTGVPLAEIDNIESIETVTLTKSHLELKRRQFPFWKDADSFRLG